MLKSATAGLHKMRFLTSLFLPVPPAPPARLEQLAPRVSLDLPAPPVLLVLPV